MTLEQGFAEIVSHPIPLTLLAVCVLLAALWHWINKNKSHEKHLERCVESYQKIFEAYSAIVQNGYVRKADWENIKEAHWIANTFLPKNISKFTKEWAQKSTDAYFLHQRIGRFGHVGMTHIKIARMKIELEEPIKDESKDENAIIVELKGKDPTPIYRKYLPIL